MQALDQILTQINETLPAHPNALVDVLIRLAEQSSNYRRSSTEPTHAAKFQTPDGGWWTLEPPSGSVRLEDFDWRADQTPTEQTAAFQAALNFFSRTSAAGFPGRGVGKLILPKGIIKINSTISYTSALGLIIEGQGPETTAIEFHNDTDTFLRFNTYLTPRIRDLSIIHVATEARASWTNKCFELIPTSGGARFFLENVETSGFNRIYSDEGLVNGDTVGSDGCRHDGFTTFFHSRNTQAVIHEFSRLTLTSPVSEAVNACFDIAGPGMIHINTANIVFNGPTLKLADVASKYGDASMFTFTNAKWEWRGQATRIVQALGANIVANLLFLGCSITGNEATLAPESTATIPWGEFNAGNIRAQFIGGAFAGIIHVTPRTANNGDGDFISFNGCRKSPSPILLSGVAGSHTPEIQYENCLDRPNQSVAKDNGRMMRAKQMHVFANPTASNDTLSTGAGSAYNLPFSGPGIVDTLRLLVQSASGGSAKTGSVFRDAGLTDKICDVIVPSGTISTPTLIASDLAAGGAYVAGPVYCSWANPNSNTIVGQFIMERTSVAST